MTVALRDLRKLDVAIFQKSAVRALKTANQRTVYLALLTISGNGSLVWASQATIAEEACVSDRTVRNVLPELEELGVLRRASEDVLDRLADRLQQYPGTVVYELIAVDPMREAEAAPKPKVDQRRLDVQVAEVAGDLDPTKRRSAVVSIIRQYMSHRLERPIDFAWLIRLYNTAARQGGPKAGEARLVEAATQTVQARPQGEPLGYMTRILSRKEVAPAVEGIVPVADLGNRTEGEFGDW